MRWDFDLVHSAHAATWAAVLHSSGEDLGDGLDSAVRVPGETRQIVSPNIFPRAVAKVVEEKKRVKVGRLPETERAAQVHARAFERRFGFDESFDRPNGHENTPEPKVESIGRGGANALTRYFRALCRRLVLFFNCFLRASTCFDISMSSCFATCAALRALASTLPAAEPIFTAASLSLFFLAM